MMPYQAFPISEFKTGISDDRSPWILPKDAFQELINGYIKHGIVHKRSGIRIFGYFVNSSTTTISSITQPASPSPGVVTVASAAGLSDGDWFQIRNATGMTEVNNITYQIAGLAGTSFNLTTIYGEDVATDSFGAYSGGGEFFLVPKNPIMGIKLFVSDDNTNNLLIFDTNRMCVYNTGTQVFDPVDTSDIFAADNTMFVSGAGFGRTSLFSTPTYFFSNYTGDSTLTNSPIRTWVNGGTTTTIFAPDTTPTAGTRNYIQTAKFIFSIKQRLVLLSTVEGATAVSGTPIAGTQYSQRARWSQIDNPGSSNSWDEITPGLGGYVDAATSESIISAVQLQNLILVFFTNSVWALEPTSDPALPLRWVKVNSIRACDAPFGTVSYDRFCVAYGTRGVYASDRVDTKRIDDKIEFFTKNEVNNDFFDLVYSGRNFQEQRAWTIYPYAGGDPNDSPNEESETSNYALVRSDDDGSYSFYEIRLYDLDTTTDFSCLGHGFVAEDLAFQDFVGALDYSLADFSSEIWSSYFTQGESEIFLGGDQKGRVHFLESQGSDLGQPIEFTLFSAGWNPYAQEGFQSQLGYVDFYVDSDVDTQFTVYFYSDDITSPYASQVVDCLPNLGFNADITAVTLANPVVITAPGYNLATGDTCFIYNINGTIDLIGGPYTITVVDSNSFSLDGIDGTSFSAYTDGGKVYERGYENTKCWKRAYAGGKGYNHYIEVKNEGTNDVLRINAIIPWFRKCARIIG